MASWELKVAIIEPGFMRTKLIEGHEEALSQLWMNLATLTKERWGETYFNAQLKKVMNNYLIKLAQDPILVVRALQHAVSSTQPKIRYRPGWQSPLLILPLSMMPAWFADMVVALLYNTSEKPAGVLKQIQQPIE
ncbi:unnamed protein product [Didymodactylos carnosus]|uniref:Uncharacterized protein n=2 Tax=Didymodactylos carnosus TaxID=1234261 RepID=A0A8S2ZM49_9BILA|nr:unnamed protein product [Didymodactylos carnosus]